MDYLKTSVLSCGCLNKEITATRNKENRKYEYCNHRIYDCWKDMIRRCTQKDRHNAKSYVLKGITVCEEWYDFERVQEWALNNGYADDLTLDRIDNNKDYGRINERRI